jgi:hypothetical protein
MLQWLVSWTAYARACHSSVYSGVNILPFGRYFGAGKV